MKNSCFFYLKKSTLGPSKEQETAGSQFQKTFKLNQNDLINVLKPKELKREQFRGK
jgi:hypothetical protein